MPAPARIPSKEARQLPGEQATEGAIWIVSLGNLVEMFNLLKLCTASFNPSFVQPFNRVHIIFPPCCRANGTNNPFDLCDFPPSELKISSNSFPFVPAFPTKAV